MSHTLSIPAESSDSFDRGDVETQVAKRIEQEMKNAHEGAMLLLGWTGDAVGGSIKIAGKVTEETVKTGRTIWNVLGNIRNAWKGNDHADSST